VNTLHLIHSSTPETKTQPCLKDVVARVVRRYLQDMGHARSNDLYDTVLAEVEPALLQEVMIYSPFPRADLAPMPHPEGL